MLDPSSSSSSKSSTTDTPEPLSPSSFYANERNPAIACLSVGADGVLLLHKVMRHLDVQDHLALFQTCRAFRRILIEETEPTAACMVFPQAINKVLDHLEINDHEETLTRTRHMANMYVHPADNDEIQMVIQVMAISTPVAAAVLSTFCKRHENLLDVSISKRHADLFEGLCEVWRGESEQRHPSPPEFIWECCNDDMVMAAVSRKRRRGVKGEAYEIFRSAPPAQSTDSKRLCVHHCHWLEDVLSVIFSHRCYDIKAADLEDIVDLAILCRNPTFIATHILGILEKAGVASACPSPFPPAFDSFPIPPPPYTEEPPPDAHFDGGEQGRIGQSCLVQLWNEASPESWDPLLDHMLLRYRLPQLGANFREECRDGRTAVAMRILEVRGAWLDPEEIINDDPLSLAIEGKHEETVQFLLWIGRKAIEETPDSEIDTTVVVPPWLKRIRSNLEDLARRPSGDHTTLRVTLSGIRAAAHFPVVFNPIHPQRAPLRQAAAKGTLSILNLLAHAAGGWQALSHLDGTNEVIVHQDMQMPMDDPHLLRGLEDLLYEACRIGEPDTVRFLVDKIRDSFRTASATMMDHDDAENPVALFVKTLSLCLETTCSRPGSIGTTTVLDICRCLIFETEEDELGLPSASPHLLVASPTLRDGRMLDMAVQCDHEAVVSLLLSHPLLPASALYPAIVSACEADNDRILSLLLVHPSVDVHADPENVHSGRLRITEDVRLILSKTRDDGALRAGHVLVTSAIVKGQVRTLRVLLQDPRFDAGSGLMALKLACKSKKSEMVVEVLAAETYAEVFRAGREGGDASIASEIGEILTQFTVQMVVEHWKRDVSLLPTLGYDDGALKEHIMARTRETSDMLKWLLLTGWVDPIPLKTAIAKQTKFGKPWQRTRCARVKLILSETRDDLAVSADQAYVTSAIVTGHVRTLRVLLQDPRFDAGSGLLALKLACKSKKPETVMEVLTAGRYAEAFRADRE
ncbi:hypothetical protein HDU96_001668, partial [Phlyctochytrium bullatum]